MNIRTLLILCVFLGWYVDDSRFVTGYPARLLMPELFLSNLESEGILEGKMCIYNGKRSRGLKKKERLPDIRLGCLCRSCSSPTLQVKKLWKIRCACVMYREGDE